MHYTRLSASVRVVVPFPSPLAVLLSLSLSAFLSFLLLSPFPCRTTASSCLLRPPPIPFLRVSVLPFQSDVLFVYFPWSISFLPAYHRAMLLSLFLSLNLSLVLFAKTMLCRGERSSGGDERVRRIVIMRSHLSCLASLESRRGEAREEATERRKRLQTGAGGNDSVAMAMGRRRCCCR